MSATIDTLKPVETSQSTFADLLCIVARRQELTARKRSQLCSAVRVVGRALGGDLNKIVADPVQLRAGLARIGRGPAAVTAHYWGTVRSRLRRVLDFAGIETYVMYGQYNYSPAWGALLNHIPHARTRKNLTSLAKFCTNGDISPQEVDDATTERFLLYLRDTSRDKRPIQVQRTACQAWNEAARQVPSWPKTILTMIDRRKTYALGWERFPASLKLDVDDYLRSIEGAASRSFGEPGDAFVGVRLCTRRVRNIEIRGYISALVHKGYDPRALKSLREAVAIDAFKTAIEFFLERGSGYNKKTARSFSALVIRIARRWVRVEAEHLRQLRVMAKRLGSEPKQMGETVRSRMAQFEDRRNVASLLLLPEKLIATVRKGGEPTFADALRVQSAVCIELLTVTPMTLTLLSELDINRHFSQDPASNRLQMTIPAHAGSNRVPIHIVFPAETQRLIELYLSRYRPVLAARQSDWLFPGKSGPRFRAGLGVQISECVKSECGLVVTSRMFRTIAGKLILDRQPGNYGSVRLYLGHKYVKTSSLYFGEYESNAAHRQFDALVLNERGRNDTPSRSSDGV
jgi:hypothetical protein